MASKALPFPYSPLHRSGLYIYIGKCVRAGGVLEAIGRRIQLEMEAAMEAMELKAVKEVRELEVAKNTTVLKMGGAAQMEKPGG